MNPFKVPKCACTKTCMGPSTNPKDFAVRKAMQDVVHPPHVSLIRFPGRFRVIHSHNLVIPHIVHMPCSSPYVYVCINIYAYIHTYLFMGDMFHTRASHL